MDCCLFSMVFPARISAGVWGLLSDSFLISSQAMGSVALLLLRLWVLQLLNLFSLGSHWLWAWRTLARIWSIVVKSCCGTFFTSRILLLNFLNTCIFFGLMPRLDAREQEDWKRQQNRAQGSRSYLGVEGQLNIEQLSSFDLFIPDNNSLLCLPVQQFYPQPLMPSQTPKHKRPATSKNNSARKASPKVRDWMSVLDQINEVTDRVKSLCSSSQKKSSYQASPRIITPFTCSSQPKTSFKDALENNPWIFATPAKRMDNPWMFATPAKRRECNLDCHDLMAECNKLNKLNEQLIREKQLLEKRLYFESKEKRELRWKLEKELASKIPPQRQTNQSVCREIRLIPAPKSSSASQASCLTAKRSPLKEKSQNRVNPRTSFKSKTSKDESKTQSLLIDFNGDSNEYFSENRSLAQKTMKSISLEKELQELLQVSKLEKDSYKKRVIRDQMKYVAQEIKSLRLEP